MARKSTVRIGGPGASHENRRDDYRDRKRVPEHDRRQCTKHRCALLLLQTKRHSK